VQKFISFFFAVDFLSSVNMPEEYGTAQSVPGSSRGGKARVKEKDRGSRDPSYGDYKDDIIGSTSGVGTGNASEGKGGSGINRVNRKQGTL
jgi:hypothetical protein